MNQQTMEMLINNLLAPVLVAIFSSGFATAVANRWGKNGEILNKLSALELKIDSLEKKEDALEKKEDETRIETYRTRILRFADEIRKGEHHEKESFNEVIDVSINRYQRYCQNHPDFQNNLCASAIKVILETYDKAFKENDF